MVSMIHRCTPELYLSLEKNADMMHGQTVGVAFRREIRDVLNIERKRID